MSIASTPGVPGLASEAVLRRTMIAVVFGGLMSMLDSIILSAHNTIDNNGLVVTLRRP